MLTLGENHISIGRGTSFGEYLYLTAWERTCAGGNFTPEIHIGENWLFDLVKTFICLFFTIKKLVIILFFKD